jgi:hypothetical protein
MDENLTSHANSRISGAMADSVGIQIHPPIRDRMAVFPTDFRQSHLSMPVILANPENPVTQRIL